MALVERIRQTTQATFWRGAIPLNYVYTPGRAVTPFLKALKDSGKLHGARCEECAYTYVPPRTFCERCFARIEKNVVELPPRGVVHTYTICHEAFDGTDKEPSIVAMIRLDGADGFFMHRLGEVDASLVHCGMPVVAVFEPKDERQGSVLDIRWFKPAE